MTGRRCRWKDLTGFDAVVEPNSVVTADVVVRLTGRTLLGALLDFDTADGTSTTTDNALDTNSVSPFVPDYDAVVSQTVVFGANTTLNSSTTVVSVTIRDDDIDEFIEVFNALLSNAIEPSSDGAGRVGGLSLTITDAQADVIIVDADLAPVLVISNPDPVVEGAAPTVTVTLIGASSRGVTVDAAPVGGTATAGSDYTRTTSMLSWASDETGAKTFTVTTLPDSVEEDAESVVLKLRNASSTGPLRLGTFLPGVILLDASGDSDVRSDGVRADATAVLQINDDEPVMTVVTLVSDGEAMAGDPFFLVVAGGAPSAGDITSLGLISISNVDEVLQKMHGLGEIRSKAATYVMLGWVPADQPQGPITYNATVASTAVSATLDVVGARSNRNFFVHPGINFTGLGLVPEDPSIATLLEQPVPNAYWALRDAIKDINPDLEVLDRDVVTLADVIRTIYAFNFSGIWTSFNTADPVVDPDTDPGPIPSPAWRHSRACW